MDQYDNYDENNETMENIDENNEKTPKNKTKNKKIHKTKKIVKKSRGRKPKKKVVYKNKQENSGCFTFFLLLIIMALLGIIIYLIYTNYYEENNKSIKNNSIDIKEEEKICEAKTTKYNISNGLSKCSDSQEFKLSVVGTDLTFVIARTNDDKTPYIINNIYDNDVVIANTNLTGINVSDNWQLKTKDNLFYLLIENPANNLLTIIDNGKVIYSDNSNTEYKLGFDITYTKYTSLGLENIASCAYYEENNTLNEELWAKGTLTYKNGKIIDEITEIITAEDVCK